MTIKKCDRCGAIIPQGETFAEYITHGIKRIFEHDTIPDDLIIRNKDTLLDYDLCPDCKKSLKEWLQGGNI